jgi:hypothetical protein
MVTPVTSPSPGRELSTVRPPRDCQVLDLFTTGVRGTRKEHGANLTRPLKRAVRSPWRSGPLFSEMASPSWATSPPIGAGRPRPLSRSAGLTECATSSGAFGEAPRRTGLWHPCRADVIFYQTAMQEHAEPHRPQEPPGLRRRPGRRRVGDRLGCGRVRTGAYASASLQRRARRGHRTKMYDQGTKWDR